MARVLGNATRIPDRRANGRAEASAPAQVAENTTHRVNVIFSAEAYASLCELAQQRDQNISDVIRHALKLERWFTDVQQAGGRILVERDGQLREVVRIS